MSLGLSEIVLILIVVLILFGGKRIPELAKALGRAQYEYKKARDMLQNEAQELKKDIAEMQEYFPVICGEWCLFNSLAVGCDTKGGQTVLNGVEGMAQETVSAEEKKKIYNAVAEAQLDAWNAGSGYFYWSYKLLTDTVNTPGWVGWDSWDFGRCADFGWFPTEK